MLSRWWRAPQGRHAAVPAPVATTSGAVAAAVPPWESTPAPYALAVVAEPPAGEPSARDELAHRITALSLAPAPVATVLPTRTPASPSAQLPSAPPAVASPPVRQPPPLPIEALPLSLPVSHPAPAMDSPVRVVPDAAAARPFLPSPALDLRDPAARETPTAARAELQGLVAAVAGDPARSAPMLVPQQETRVVQDAEPAAVVCRVLLGFRDGSTAQLDPASAQAAALEELATLLSLRD